MYLPNPGYLLFIPILYHYCSLGSLNFILLVSLFAVGIMIKPQINAMGNMVSQVATIFMIQPECKPKFLVTPINAMMNVIGPRMSAVLMYLRNLMSIFL